MILEPFQFADLTSPITPASLLVLGLLGVLLGAVVFSETAMRAWSPFVGLVIAGAVFFLPLAVLRNADGISNWEALLGDGILWLWFSLCVVIGIAVRRRLAP